MHCWSGHGISWSTPATTAWFQSPIRFPRGGESRSNASLDSHTNVAPPLASKPTLIADVYIYPFLAYHIIDRSWGLSYLALFYSLLDFLAMCLRTETGDIIYFHYLKKYIPIFCYPVFTNSNYVNTEKGQLWIMWASAVNKWIDNWLLHGGDHQWRPVLQKRWATGRRLPFGPHDLLADRHYQKNKFYKRSKTVFFGTIIHRTCS